MYLKQEMYLKLCCNNLSMEDTLTNFTYPKTFKTTIPQYQSIIIVEFTIQLANQFISWLKPDISLGIYQPTG